MAQPIQLDAEMSTGPAKNSDDSLKMPEIPSVSFAATPSINETPDAISSVQKNIAATKAEEAKTSTDGDKSFSNIFTRSAQKKEESKLLATVLEQKNLPQKPKSILGIVPALEKTIALEKELGLRRQLGIAQFLFASIFLAGLGMALYFFTELAPAFDAFGPNTTHRLANLNDNLLQLQTDANKYRYLAAQLKLNEFAYQADRFFSNVNKTLDTSNPDTGNAAAIVEETKSALPTLLKDIRSFVNKDISVKKAPVEGQQPKNEEETRLEAEVKLRDVLRAERKNFNKDMRPAPEDISNLKFVDNAVKLVGNKNFISNLNKVAIESFAKDLDDYVKQPDGKKLIDLQNLIGSVLATTRSDLSVMTEIKKNRLNWSTVITKINNETRSIKDAHFDDKATYEKYGGIVYTGYEFDSAANKIVLSGISKTIDGANFTLLSNLIQQLESSPDFEGVEMRSFTKNKIGTADSAESYTANFKIDLILQKSSASPKDRPASI